jgi:hypothetical protein
VTQSVEKDAGRLTREQRAGLDRRITEHIVDLIEWELEHATDPFLELCDEYGEAAVQRAFRARINRMGAR